jgi:diguanylate cyclase (GGDEF)-like protein/PAS domain S-box-containing protein
MTNHKDGGRQAKVLVADDDAVLRLLSRKALEKAGFEVFEAENGEQVVSAFDRLHPDIVMLDVMMPVLDGFSACVEIRKRPEGELTPILMVTGLDDVDSIRRAYEAGATDFVTKPINWLVLGHRMMYMLRASRSIEALRDSEEQYALAATGANDGLWDWDLRADECHFSLRWKGMLGYDEHEIGSSPEEWLKRIHPDDVDRVKLELSAHVDGVSSHFQSEYRLRQKDGTYRWMLSRGIAVRGGGNIPYRMAGSQTDITESKRIAEQLQHDALYDPLTKLPNRALFMDRLGHAVTRGERSKSYNFAVLFLDLDRFKLINDSLGHSVGDQLLIQIAERIGRFIRPADTLARLGGDEFVILIEDIKEAGCAAFVAERIKKLLCEPFCLDGREVFTTASIGIAIGSGEYDRPEELLRDADIAMYRAKAEDRGNYVVFDPAMRKATVELLRLENDLRRALERHEFQMFYQPIIDLQTDAVVALEALVRWRHPARGLVSPGSFIPIAEETGLIIRIGEWVLYDVCRQMRIWNDQGADIRVAVNLSTRQLKDKDFPSLLSRILEETNADPGSLELEITESSVINDWDSAIATLSALKDLGVCLSLDDFGTGYSSLSYLHRLPVSKLKIDRSFLKKMATSAEHSGIVRAILDLANTLRMEVVAEGIETEGQLAQLKEMRCKLGQGYFFGKPQDERAVTALIPHLQKTRGRVEAGRHIGPSAASPARI